MPPLCLSMGAGITSTNVPCVSRLEYGDSHGRNVYESIKEKSCRDFIFSEDF